VSELNRRGSRNFPFFFEVLPVFLDSQPTPLDIRFRLMGFPVRVTPWFWLTMALLGSFSFSDRQFGVLAGVIWVLCAFISILIHEIGHAISASWFRTPSHIVLVAFGGFAEYYHGPPPSGWRRLIVCLMGPIAGFLLLGAVYFSNMSTDWMSKHPVLMLIGFYLIVQNLVWNIFNLFPIWPLDGGQAMREILYILGVKRPDPATHMISITICAIMILFGVMVFITPENPMLSWMPFVPSPIMMIWLALIGVNNWQMLQQYSKQYTWEEDNDNPPWLRGR
jgi:stage IV sporulation protein FB